MKNIWPPPNLLDTLPIKTFFINIHLLQFITNPQITDLKWTSDPPPYLLYPLQLETDEYTWKTFGKKIKINNRTEVRIIIQVGASTQKVKTRKLQTGIFGIQTLSYQRMSTNFEYSYFSLFILHAKHRIDMRQKTLKKEKCRGCCFEVTRSLIWKWISPDLLQLKS